MAVTNWDVVRPIVKARAAFCPALDGGRRAMMSTAVDARSNGHSAKTYGNPLGIECESCKRRALVPLDRLGQLDSNMRPLRGWPFKCSACGSREVAPWLFPVDADVLAFAVARGWLELSPDAHSVRVTAKGSRVVQ